MLYLTTTVEPPDTTVLHVRGEVDLTNADALRERLLVEIHRNSRLTVDVSRAMFIDAAALRALAAARREATRIGKHAPTLRGIRPLLAHALRINGMADHFPREHNMSGPTSRTVRPRRPAVASPQTSSRAAVAVA